MAFVAGVGFALLVRKGYRYVENADNLAMEDYENMPRRAVMSMLVHCAYFRDLDQLTRMAAWWLDYNNSRAKNYGEYYWRELQPASKLELKELGLAFFRREPGHRNPGAPDLAVVLRGTVLTKPADWSADIKRFLQLLDTTERVERTMELILDVLKDFPDDNQICMAGHSLGAAIALIVGGRLYNRKIHIDTHLFNPPLVALDDSRRSVSEPTFRAHVEPGQPDQVSVLEAETNASRWKEAFVSATNQRCATNG